MTIPCKLMFFVNIPSPPVDMESPQGLGINGLIANPMQHQQFGHVECLGLGISQPMGSHCEPSDFGLVTSSQIDIKIPEGRGTSDINTIPLQHLHFPGQPEGEGSLCVAPPYGGLGLREW